MIIDRLSAHFEEDKKRRFVDGKKVDWKLGKKNIHLFLRKISLDGDDGTESSTVRWLWTHIKFPLATYKNMNKK